MAKSHIDIPMRWWIQSCPGPVNAETKDGCLKRVQEIVGEYELYEVEKSLDRLGYRVLYRTRADGGGFWTIPLPDQDWIRR